MVAVAKTSVCSHLATTDPCMSKSRRKMVDPRLMACGIFRRDRVHCGYLLLAAWLVAPTLAARSACETPTAAGEPTALQTASVGGFLTIDASEPRLAIDGRPRFLAGVSLFDALGRTPPRDQDLDALGDWGVSILRVWAHWSDPIYASDGSLTAEGRARLERLAARLRARHLVLELVLLRPGQLPGQRYAVLSSPAARTKAVQEITRALLPYRLVLFDLFNEHDHPDGPISHAEARTLRDAVKAIDPARLVTISSTEYHLLTAEGSLSRAGLQNLHAEVSTGEGDVAVDLLAVHLPRTGDWIAATSGRVGLLAGELQRLARRLPIYINEGERVRPGVHSIPPGDYLLAVRSAREAGAAGWVLHTAAGYAVGETPFLDALSGDERQALSELGKTLGTPK
jgi:hypothetical protein